MNIPLYHPDQTQAMGLHSRDYAQDLCTLEGPSTSQEPKAEPGGQVDPQERCPVCGDRVSGYHYGLLTCESCKGFFKRTVQNNKRYTCAERQSCPMDPAQRKRCPSCRFQKCLAVGMRREAVRADRMRGGRNKFGPLYRRDRQLKQQRGMYNQPNSAPYRIKLETQPAQLAPLSHDFHLLPVPNPTPAVLHPDPYHAAQPHPPSNTGQSEFPVLLDSPARDRVLASPSHPPYTGLYHPPFHGYALEKRPVSFGYSPPCVSPPPLTPPKPMPLPMFPAVATPSCTPTPTGTLTPTSTPSSTPTPTPTHTPTPTVTPTPSTPTPTPMPTPGLAPLPAPAASAEDFLERLMEGEPDEGQLCARVLSSLQREQANRGKHDRLNTFSIMCKMADQTLFGLVEWARNSALFKELKVDDQMALLQSCWSELLVLDHLCRQVAYGKDGCIYLVTGQQIEVSNVFSQAGVTLSSLVSRTQDLVSKLRSLQLNRQDFVCLKYLVLFNPDVKSVQDREQVERTQEQVNRALMEHTLRTHPGYSDKFGQLLLRLPEVRSISLQVEEYLYQRHLLGDLPCNSLLTEMLHAKHS